MVVTISEVAAAASVSTSTVSRVFTAPEQVSSRTRGLVRQVSAQLGYTPKRGTNGAAQVQTGMLGLIVPDVVNPFFPPMIKAVLRLARQHDYAVLVADTDEQVGDEADLAVAMAKQVDALILWSSRLAPDQLHAVADRVPTVVVNQAGSGLPTVIASSADGMRQGVEHLHALGHLRCCYINGSRDSWSNTHRREAVLAGCRSIGMEASQLGPYESMFDAGIHAADLVVSEGATAVLAHNDVIALGLIRQLTARRIRIPQDISIIGVDDTLLATMSTPALTTVRIPVNSVALRAVGLALQLLRSGGATESIVEVPTQLVIRESTGPAPA